MTYLRIPLERVGVLIGKGGETKRAIEERTRVKIEVDSETGEVQVVSYEDPAEVLRAMNIIRAIGRGFSPERAFKLLEDEMISLDIIDLSEYARNRNDLERIKGRIIGRGGRTREIFEEMTGALISIYGKTVAIIGYPEQIQVAKRGIMMLIDGAPHGAVYAYLEKMRRELKQMEMDYRELP
ncbi:MAG: RNA-processing protein [Archaeoglobi archaeon]|nr:RNA-processing protein [Candidatus Mnemosynella bozhongmuii]